MLEAVVHVAVMPTRIILAAAGLVLLNKVTAVHHSHPVRQCTLRHPVGNQTVLAHQILTVMVDERQLGMLLHVLRIPMRMEEGRRRGMLVLGHLILMRQDQMGVPLVLVLVQVGVVLRLPELLVVGRHQPHRPLLLLYLHGVHLLRPGVLLRELLQHHGTLVGWVVFNFVLICLPLITFFIYYYSKVLLPPQQQLHQEFIWDLPLLMLLLLRLAVKHQHTLQVMVLAVLLLLVAQCYPVMISILPKKTVSDVFIFRILFLICERDF